MAQAVQRLIYGVSLRRDVSGRYVQGHHAGEHEAIYTGQNGQRFGCLEGFHKIAVLKFRTFQN